MNPTKNLIELKFYMNPTKNLIDPKLYMIPTKNLIELKLYMNPTKNLIEPKHQVFSGDNVNIFFLSVLAFFIVLFF
jgi:hypothetical protein